MFNLMIVLVLIDLFIASSPQMMDLLTSTTTNFDVKELYWSTLVLQVAFECNG